MKDVREKREDALDGTRCGADPRVQDGTRGEASGEGERNGWEAEDFMPPKKRGEATRFLYVANCGTAVGVDLEDVKRAFEDYGEVEQVVDGCVGKGRGALVYVVFKKEEDARKAQEEWKRRENPTLGGRKINVQFAKVVTESESQQLETAAVEDPGSLDLPGMQLYPEFVTEKEEEKILQAIDNGSWERLAKRRVQHYGYAFDYGTRQVDTQKPLGCLPIWAVPVLERARKVDPRLVGFDQLTVNEYSKGVGLSPHVDTHSSFGDAILSLTIGGHTVMEFRKDGLRKSLLLPSRSLLVMAGECRYGWQHYIPHRKFDLIGTELVARPQRRVSLTFRQVRQTPCECSFPNQCDTARDASKLPLIEQNFVQNMYNRIAPHFSSTRFAIWPKVKLFLESLRPHSLVADVGCGNGKYLGIRPDLAVLGSDISEELLKICATRGFDVVVADGVHLPYRDDCLDALISIAVLHHISTLERRQAVIKEFLRVVRPGGRIFITVWALEQDNPDKTINKWLPLPQKEEKGRDFFVPWHLPLHRPETAAAVKKTMDAAGEETLGEFDKEKKTVVFKRFYHVFERDELPDLVNSVQHTEVLDTLYDRSNWCVSFRKNID